MPVLSCVAEWAEPPPQTCVRSDGAMHANLVRNERDERSHLKWTHLCLSGLGSV